MTPVVSELNFTPSSTGVATLLSTCDGLVSFNSVTWPLADGTSCRQQTKARRGVPGHPLSRRSLLTGWECSLFSIGGCAERWRVEPGRICPRGRGAGGVWDKHHLLNRANMQISAWFKAEQIKEVVFGPVFSACTSPDSEGILECNDAVLPGSYITCSGRRFSFSSFYTRQKNKGSCEQLQVRQCYPEVGLIASNWRSIGI